MFQREALWIEFYNAGDKTPCAIKVSVGGDLCYIVEYDIQLMTHFRG
jgi:hypothetical protein